MELTYFLKKHKNDMISLYDTDGSRMTCFCKGSLYLSMNRFNEGWMITEVKQSNDGYFMLTIE